jgi:2-keto-3-deoxy-L-rhamnonate aldolase RhmA
MNRIKARWSEKSAAICSWLRIPGGLHAEAIAAIGFDAVD